MASARPHDLKKLSVHSSDRISGEPHDYVVRFNETFNRVVEVDLESIELPNTLYAINGVTQMFITSAIDGPIVVTMKPGNYTASEFVDSMNTQINAVRADLTASYDTITGKLNMADVSSTFIINPGTHPVFGFETLPTPIAATAEADNLLVIATPNVLYLRIDELAHSLVTSMYSTSTTLSHGVFARVQLRAGGFGVDFYREQLWNASKFRARFPVHFQQLRVRWTDESGNPVDFNNVDHSFTLNVVTQ